MQEITQTDTKTTAAPKPQTVKRKIGKTTYELSLHFSQTSTERMSDKVMRLLENDLSAKNDEKIFSMSFTNRPKWHGACRLSIRLCENNSHHLLLLLVIYGIIDENERGLTRMRQFDYAKLKDQLWNYGSGELSFTDTRGERQAIAVPQAEPQTTRKACGNCKNSKYRSFQRN